MKIRIIPTLAVTLLIALAQTPTMAEATPATIPSDRAAQERQFAQKLSHARLIGFYSIVGQEGPPKEDEYTLGAVTRSEGDKWLFIASLQFGKKVINVPLEIPVLWAGNTPVISVTDIGIPGMGTYTARVMFYGDHYAGTWSSADHVGYLWGRVQATPQTQNSPDKPAEK